MKKLILAVLFVLMSSVSNATISEVLVHSTAEDDDGMWYVARLNDDPKATAGESIGRADIVLSQAEGQNLMMPFDSTIDAALKFGVKGLKIGKYLVAQYVGSTGAMVFYNATSNGTYIEVVGEPIIPKDGYLTIDIDKTATQTNTELIKLKMR